MFDYYDLKEYKREQRRAKIRSFVAWSILWLSWLGLIALVFWVLPL